MNKWIVESRPLDGRYDGMDKVVEAGTDLQPIYDELGLLVFSGGRFPSGHIEYYHPQGEWLQESLPMSEGDAKAYLNSRVDRGDTNFQYRVRELK